MCFKANPADVLRLKRMKFFGYHGVFQEERRLGGEYIVDVELQGDFSRASTEDNIERTVDLSVVYKKVKSIVCEQSFNLIETLAEAIALEMISSFKINQATVRVRKTTPPIQGIIESTEAVVTRRRET